MQVRLVFFFAEIVSKAFNDPGVNEDDVKGAARQECDVAASCTPRSVFTVSRSSSHNSRRSPEPMSQKHLSTTKLSMVSVQLSVAGLSSLNQFHMECDTSPAHVVHHSTRARCAQKPAGRGGCYQRRGGRGGRFSESSACSKRTPVDTCATRR